MIKQSIFRVARSSLFSTLVTLLDKFEHRRNLLRVLTYHRVDDPDAQPDLDPHLISATPDNFARQMELLAERARVVSIDEVLAAIRGNDPLPPRSVLITFDDAYRDFSTHAWPTLRRLGLPATMFVPTAFPDHPRQFWWDTVFQVIRGCDTQGDLAALGIERTEYESPTQTYRRVAREMKTLPHEELLARVAQWSRQCELAAPVSPVMSWNELGQLVEQGLTLGAHTKTHPLLNRVTVEQAVDEAVGSLEDLQARFPQVPRIIAYPGGAFSDDVIQRLHDHFELGFTTCRGINDLATADPWRLRRINVSRQTPASLVRAQLLAGVRHFNRRWPLESAV